MRWRFVDKVFSFEPWEKISGAKAVSLEEYDLLSRFGRRGFFPESLVLAAALELARWLVAASSEFEETCLLAEVETFVYQAAVGRGDVLEIDLAVSRRGPGLLQVTAAVRSRVQAVAGGSFLVNLAPLSVAFDRELLEGRWRNLHGAS